MNRTKAKRLWSLIAAGGGIHINEYMYFMLKTVMLCTELYTYNLDAVFPIHVVSKLCSH